MKGQQDSKAWYKCQPIGMQKEREEASKDLAELFHGQCGSLSRCARSIREKGNASNLESGPIVTVHNRRGGKCDIKILQEEK